MTQTDRLIIDFGELDWSGPGAACARIDGAVEGELIASWLMRVIRSGAEHAAENAVIEPVSLNLDTTGLASSGGLIEFDCEIDRRTRTLVFAHGSARLDGRALMTATAVYRITG